MHKDSCQKDKNKLSVRNAHYASYSNNHDNKIHPFSYF